MTVSTFLINLCRGVYSEGFRPERVNRTLYRHLTEKIRTPDNSKEKILNEIESISPNTPLHDQVRLFMRYLGSDLIYKEIGLKEKFKSAMPANKFTREEAEREVERLSRIEVKNDEGIKVSFGQEEPLDSTMSTPGGLCTAYDLSIASQFKFAAQPDGSTALKERVEEQFEVCKEKLSSNNFANQMGALQFALNQIYVDSACAATPEINQMKAKALVASHGFKILRSSDEIPMNFVYMDRQSKENHLYCLKEEIEKLAQGIFFVRTLRSARPTKSATKDKHEWYGHSLFLIKLPNISYLYDPGSGMLELRERLEHFDLALHLAYLNMKWGLETTTFHQLAETKPRSKL